MEAAQRDAKAFLSSATNLSADVLNVDLRRASAALGVVLPVVPAAPDNWEWDDEEESVAGGTIATLQELPVNEERRQEAQALLCVEQHLAAASKAGRCHRRRPHGCRGR
jgi:hypothetical protein